MTKYRSIGEVTSNPIANKKIMHVAISDEDYKLLKKRGCRIRHIRRRDNQDRDANTHR